MWNGAGVAASLGIAPNTARAYLEALEQTYMVRRLQPWHANLGKRLVKSPKIYLRASGVSHTLQGIRSGAELDLLMVRNGRRWGIEFKQQDAPAMTRSLTVAMIDLDLAGAWIVYPGTRTYELGERVTVHPLESFATNDGTPLGDGWH